jgi:hypothetical protein
MMNQITYHKYGVTIRGSFCPLEQLGWIARKEERKMVGYCGWPGKKKDWHVILKQLIKCTIWNDFLLGKYHIFDENGIWRTRYRWSKKRDVNEKWKNFKP